MQKLGLQTFEGTPTGAIYGFLNMLNRLEKDLACDHIAVVFDSQGKNFRHEIYPEYKANRGPMPDELSLQIEPLFECIEALRIPLISKTGFEADDLIGTLASQAEDQGYQVFISSGDKDFSQLISKNILQSIPQKNKGDLILDQEGVFKKFGVYPHQIIDFLALVGDTSDNVPGVRDCGPKTAASWLGKYKNLETIIKNIDLIKGRGSKQLGGSINWLTTAKELVTIKKDVDLNVSIESLARQKPDFKKLTDLYEKLELQNLLKKLNTIETGMTGIKSPAGVKSTTARSTVYETITTEKHLEKWLKIVNESEITSIDTETTSLNPMRAMVIGISLATSANRAAYIPVGHTQDNTSDQLDKSFVLEKLKKWLEDPSQLKIGQNIKYDMHVFANQGIQLRGVSHDTLLASYVLESHKSHKLDNLADEKLNIKTTSYHELVGTGKNQLKFEDVLISKATEYAAEDADVTLQLHQHFKASFANDPNLKYIYESIEMPLIEILFQIERAGVLIDSSRLQEQSKQLDREILTLKNEVYFLAGEKFNLSSTKQLRDILFIKKKLPVIKKTPGGEASTDESVLQKLAENHPIATKLLSYRSLSKLKTTYTDKLPNMVNPTTGRIHTNYGQAVAITGRLSSSEPNLQNIPIKTTEGRKIREAFIATEHSFIVSADYSQIELRIMAHLSNDDSLVEAFKNGEDIHRHTASELYGIPLSDVTAEYRRHAKTINFGLIYGMGSYGLAKQLNIELGDAKLFIDRYFDRYPGVKHYMDATRLHAMEYGYVETVFGRRLYLPQINGKGAQKKAAEREAINAPMQGTAADLIKLAMIKVYHWLVTQKMSSRIIMQVHDELVLEVPEKELVSIENNLKNLMTNIKGLSVPLVVEVGRGDNWDEAH